MHAPDKLKELVDSLIDDIYNIKMSIMTLYIISIMSMILSLVSLISLLIIIY